MKKAPAALAAGASFVTGPDPQRAGAARSDGSSMASMRAATSCQCARCTPTGADAARRRACARMVVSSPRARAGRSLRDTFSGASPRLHEPAH
jgi:hypothetical protein